MGHEQRALSKLRVKAQLKGVDMNQNSTSKEQQRAAVAHDEELMLSLERQADALETQSHNGFKDAVRFRNLRSQIESLDLRIERGKEILKMEGN